MVRSAEFGSMLDPLRQERAGYQRESGRQKADKLGRPHRLGHTGQL